MGIFAWLIIGGLAGWIASMIMKTNKRQGLIMDIVVGIIGAFIGGFLVDVLDLGTGAGTTISGFNIPSLVTATFGAVVFLGILKIVQRPKKRK